MSIQIDRGLFRLDLIDHHAILGVPLDISAKQVRRHYLKIARRLHPDSCASEGEVAKQQASELLSKLVNPAYELLANEKEVAEYLLLLRLKGQQLQRQADTLQLASEPAQKLASAPNIEHAYKQALAPLIEEQYRSLEQSIEIIGQISELNLVYLMRTAGAKIESKAATTPPPSSNADQSAATAKPETSAPAPASTQYKATATKAPPPRRAVSLLENYFRRAEEFELRRDYPKAILELREALQTNPQNSECHSRLANIYLQANQGTMAKIHFNKALELDPKNELALQGKQKLEKAGQKAGRPAKTAQTPKDQDKPKGGLFGLFGGKKK